MSATCAKSEHAPAAERTQSEPHASPLGPAAGGIVQLQRSLGNAGTAAALGDADALEIAQRGIMGAAASLPHLGEIQRSFGERFDAGSVRVHLDPAATEAARALGARAYAVGRDVAFAGTPSLETAAHEAAHVARSNSAGTVRAGRSSKSDPAEREADAIASRVAAGDSVSGLLAAKSPIATAAVQCQDAPDGGTADAGAPDAGAPAPAESLDQRYQAALADSRATGNWQDTAELLNGFNREDIQTRIAQLTDAEIGYVHQGAIDNPRVGANSQVALLTVPGALQSTQPPEVSQQPPTPQTTEPQTPAPSTSTVDPDTGLSADEIAAMDDTGKLIAAFKSGAQQAPAAFGAQLEALLKPEALAQFAFFTLLFAALQATPAGWLTDLAIIGLEAYLIGPMVYQALQDLVNFYNGATGAKTPDDIKHAGAALADAAGILGIALLMKLIFHEGGTEEAPSGGAEMEPGKPPTAGEVEPTEPTSPSEVPKTPEEVPKTPEEIQSKLEETAGKERLSPSELKTEKAIAEQSGVAKSINEAPFTVEYDLENGHVIKETPDGKFCERCSGPCAVYNADGDLVSEDVPSFEEEYGHPDQEPGRIPELQSREPFEQERLERGQDADRAQAYLYEANQVRLENGTILDSYEAGQEIVSRKTSQLSEISDAERNYYLDEILDKYHRGLIISDTPTAQAQYPQLVGQPLSGQYILEVPEQGSPIPTDLLERAERLGITIRDFNGAVYTASQ